VFADKDKKVVADNVELPAGQTVTVYVCLLPSLPSEIQGTGECRELIGGVRVSVYKYPIVPGACGRVIGGRWFARLVRCGHGPFLYEAL
jgi:hypothetical protein